jgi:hypothetical protein
VGIEVTKVMRDPESAFWDRVLKGEEFASPIDGALVLQELVYRKDTKRASQGWMLRDRAMLVLQLMDCPVDEVAPLLDQEVLAEMCETGFLEIWLADYTILDAYGTVQLFGIKPTEWQGLHPHSGAGTKPYG